MRLWLLVLGRSDADEPPRLRGASSGSVSLGGVCMRHKMYPLESAVASMRAWNPGGSSSSMGSHLSGWDLKRLASLLMFPAF